MHESEETQWLGNQACKTLQDLQNERSDGKMVGP